MSAYVVEDDTINRIVGYLYGEAAAGQASGHSDVLAPLADPVVGYPLACPATYPGRPLVGDVPSVLPLGQLCAKLGLAMHLLNVGAVRVRYENADKANMIPNAYKYAHTNGEGRVAVYKSLACWMYQCSQGHVPESPLFKAFEKVSSALAHEIVWALPECQAAPWG